MKKYLLSIYFVLFLLSCGKKEVVDLQLVNITYEIESRTDKPFIDIIYNEVDSAGNSQIKKDWFVSGVGTFKKSVKIKKGFAAYISVVHGYNGDWSLRIISSTGEVLSSTSEGGFYSGNPSSYRGTVNATAK